MPTDPNLPRDSSMERRDADQAARTATNEVERETKELARDAKEGAKDMAQRARGEVESAASGVLDTIADQLEEFAQELRGHDLESLLDRVQSTAENRPELFFAGSVAAGLAMSRFAKSSAARREREDREDRGERQGRLPSPVTGRGSREAMQPVNAASPEVTGAPPMTADPIERHRKEVE